MWIFDNGEVTLSTEINFKFKEMPVLMVRKGSPAWNALKRMCTSAPVLPGYVIEVSDEELESLKSDVVAVYTKEQEGS